MAAQCVFDASVIVALIQGEVGVARASDLLESHEAVMSSVNLAEALSYFQRKGAPAKFDVGALIATLHAVIPFSQTDAQEVALLYRETKQAGLSLGDRACIALGRRLKTTVYTADRAWAPFASAESPIEFIRP